MFIQCFDTVGWVIWVIEFYVVIFLVLFQRVLSTHNTPSSYDHVTVTSSMTNCSRKETKYTNTYCIVSQKVYQKVLSRTGANRSLNFGSYCSNFSLSPKLMMAISSSNVAQKLSVRDKMWPFILVM